MAGESAVRRRRVRIFASAFVVLLFGALLMASFDWSDFAVGPRVRSAYVSYPSTDGVTISGIVFTPEAAQGRLPGVLVVHGLTDHKEYLNRVSVELARRGFVVLSIDLRDHGMSTGACTFGLPSGEPEDVLNGLQFLRDRPDVDAASLALMGHSFGGMAALTAASMLRGQVNATVTWAAPTNLTSLARDNFEAVAFAADKRVLPSDLLEPEQLKVRSPIEYIAGSTPNNPGLRANSTLFLHSSDDPLIPVSQAHEAYNATLTRFAQVAEVQGAGHAMRTNDVMEKTVAFIEVRTKGRVSEPLDPVYTAFERDATALNLVLTMLAWPLAWLGWEYWCSRNPNPVRHYNFPADRVRWKAVAFASADVLAFALAVVAVSILVAPGTSAPPFDGALPAPSLFSGLLALGGLLCAAAYALSLAERRTRGRDEKRFEESESIGRSLTVAVPVLLLIPVTILIQYGLFLGANYPRSAAFLLPLGVLLVVMLGFEAFLRLRVQRRMRSGVAWLFGRSGLAGALGNIFVGSLLYFVMLAWVMLWLFKGYAEVPGDPALLAIGVGVTSSILYDRTKNILPGALLSAVFVTWVMNAPFHF